MDLEGDHKRKEGKLPPTVFAQGDLYCHLH